MDLSFLYRKKISRNDMIVMLTTMSWMLSSGLALKNGVEELLSDPNNKINKAGLNVIHDGLDEGKVLSEIFKENEDLFGPGRWRQIDAAERTGKLPDCLTRIANQIKSDSDLMGKVKGAVTYPAVIILFALAAGYYMFTSIVPQMGEMMLEFGIEMPALTVMVMNFAYFLMGNMTVIAVAIVGFVIVLRYSLTHQLRHSWHKLITRIPFVGAVSINMNYSMVYTILSDMIENGAHTVEALRVSSGSSSNVFITSEILDAAEAMEREGLAITEALLKTTTMPPDDKLMLQVGSRTGRELELLADLSVRRHDAAYASVNSLMEILPTVVLLAVAVVVGIMVVSIYMPMISMATDIA